MDFETWLKSQQVLWFVCVFEDFNASEKHIHVLAISPLDFMNLHNMNTLRKTVKCWIDTNMFGASVFVRDSFFRDCMAVADEYFNYLIGFQAKYNKEHS
jgi:hypothetical protein